MAQDIGSDTALVTGASGWLGQGLLQALTNGLPDDDRLREPQRDLKVRCMVLPGESSPVLDQLGDRIEVVRGDIRDAAGVCPALRAAPEGLFSFRSLVLFIRDGFAISTKSMSMEPRTSSTPPRPPECAGRSLSRATRPAAAIPPATTALTSHRPTTRT